MSLSPRAAQAKHLRLQRRAAQRRVLHLVPHIGLCFTGDYSGLGGAFRTEGWSKEGSKWFFCGRANQENQRQIRLILAWAKGNGEQITVKRTEPRRFYSDEQLRVQGLTISPTTKPTPTPTPTKQPEPDWDYEERRAREQLAARRKLIAGVDGGSDQGKEAGEAGVAGAKSCAGKGGAASCAGEEAATQPAGCKKAAERDGSGKEAKSGGAADI